jgi:hypothetical protein
MKAGKCTKRAKSEGHCLTEIAFDVEWRTMLKQIEYQKCGGKTCKRMRTKTYKLNFSRRLHGDE